MRPLDDLRDRVRRLSHSQPGMRERQERPAAKAPPALAYDS
jgi:hypothetical protein